MKSDGTGNNRGGFVSWGVTSTDSAFAIMLENTGAPFARLLVYWFQPGDDLEVDTP